MKECRRSKYSEVLGDWLVELGYTHCFMVAGGVIAFDELNCEEFPGETAALMETIGLGRARLRRLPMDPYISWFTKE